MYRWQDGTYLNIVTDYQNWSPSAGTMQLKDCVVIRAADQWQWSQVDCREQHSFICMRRKFISIMGNNPFSQFIVAPCIVSEGKGNI